MVIEVLKSKIHRVTVTQANIDYVGSITIDSTLMEAANIIRGEKVQVVNVTNGERLETYAIEEERLLSMLEKATTVEEMIQLESRLSDIRYQIESLESRLRNWQNQVDYSTITIYLREVEELSDTARGEGGFGSTGR